MAPGPGIAAASRKAQPSQHELLDSLVGIVTRHANEHLMSVATRLVSALLDVSDPGIDARAVYQRVKSGNLLKNNNYAFFHLAASGLERALRKDTAQLLPPKLSKVGPIEVLSLVPFEEMDSKVAFNAISRPFEINYSDALATLNVRLGFLLERDILRIGQNPFRPEVFLMAINDAWREFEPDPEAHDLMLGLLKPAVLFDFAPLYEALNLALMRKGVLPGSVDALRIRKTDNAAAAAAKRATEQAALSQQLRQFFAGNEPRPAEYDIEIPLIPDLPGGAGGWRPSAAEGFRGTAPAPELPHAHAPQPGHVPQHAHAPQHGHVPGGVHAGQGVQAYAGTASFGDGSPIEPYAGEPGGAFRSGVTNQVLRKRAGPGAVSAPLLELLGKLQQSLPDSYGGFDQGGGAAQGGGGGAGAQNVFYLPRLKESMPKGSLSHGDESTIDLLSRIFETVFLDDSIPQQTRELIQFLQIPVLKAALLDKNFFFQEAHPARRMIDLMSRMGWEQRQGADDPMYKAMKRSVDRVGRDFDQELGPFAEAVAELEASIQAEETAAAKAIAEPIAQALKQEKVSAATRSAKNAVALRVGKGEVVAIVEAFLANKWTSVLTVAYSVEDEKPGAVGNAVKTMDELIWSVKPKLTAEQRRELIGKLPGLLSQLNKWLDVIKWQDADRLQFFAELAECHASIVRAPIELSPERQLEIAVEVAQQDALRRIEKENAVAAIVEAEVEASAPALDALERGIWMEFTEADASARKVKLAWISPLRTLFIFSTGARQEAFSLSSEKLADVLEAGRARVIRAEGVVARALSEAMELAVNDAAMAQPAVA
ncbi:MAG: DUF1631 family protein [Pseudomonadota bacterium]